MTQAEATMTDGEARPGEAARKAYFEGDAARAFALWRPLAEAGDREAQAWLGTLYAHGDGVTRDDAEAAKWLSAASDQGVVTAMADLGAFHFLGRGVPKDPARAISLLERAAEADDLHALFNLAALLVKGEGAPADAERAAGLLRRAAERGHRPSQARLGYLYANGVGVTKDRVEAYLWLTLAARHGVGTALEALDGVVRDMSADEKAEGIRRVEAAARSGVGVQPLTVDIMPVPA